MLTSLSCDRAGPASAGSPRPGFFGRYTKVNRLLTEGRQAFLRRVSGVERGAECARYEPVLSALADGEASAEDLARLRPHMQTCLSCRAALREFRATPERVASLVPPAALAVSDGSGPLRNLFEALAGTAQHKTAAMGERLHAATELATGQKLAAVAASAAALAGGGSAIDEFANHRGPPRPEPVQRVEGKPVKEEPPVEPAPPAVETPANESPPAPEPVPAPTPEPPPPPDPAGEFTPSAGAQAAAAPAPAPKPSGGATPSGAVGGAGAGSGGEFAP